MSTTGVSLHLESGEYRADVSSVTDSVRVAPDVYIFMQHGTSPKAIADAVAYLKTLEAAARRLRRRIETKGKIS